MTTDAAPQIRPVPAALLRPLRHAVLRAGLPPAAASFAGDEDPSSLHLAALAPPFAQVPTADLSPAAVVGCASFVREPLGGEDGYRLRGMATDPRWRRCGVGRLLLTAAAALPPTSSARLWWCNARLPAIPFYEAMGWRVISEEFDIPTAGAHRRMERRR